MRWLVCLFIAATLFADEEIEIQSNESVFAPIENGSEEEDKEKENEPEFWSTGPLIAPPGNVVEFGHVAFQPYLFWYQYRGVYDADWHYHSENEIFNSVLFQPYLRLGVFKSTEIDLVPQVYYNHFDHAAKWVFGDFPIWSSTTLLEGKKWYPSIMLQLSANLPTGKYQKLNPAKKETDLGGTGSWSPGAGLIFYKDVHLWNSHFLSITYYANYSFQTSVHVKGLNAYGGDESTHGRVHPGNLFLTILSFEFSLSQKWVLSLDTQYQHGNKATFRGETIDPVGYPAYDQFAMAPAIEYLWDENTGIIAGGWFSVAGRNADQFNSVVISVYINR